MTEADLVRFRDEFMLAKICGIEVLSAHGYEKHYADWYQRGIYQICVNVLRSATMVSISAPSMPWYDSFDDLALDIYNRGLVCTRNGT